MQNGMVFVYVVVVFFDEQKNDLKLVNKVGVLIEEKKREYFGCKDSGERILSSVFIIVCLQYGFLEDVVVYCNFNQLYKIDLLILCSWVNIFKCVFNFVLWLLRFFVVGELNFKVQVMVMGLLQECVVFFLVVFKEEYVCCGQLVDVCFDMLFCNGYIMGMDVLWVGCLMVMLLLEMLVF